MIFNKKIIETPNFQIEYWDSLLDNNSNAQIILLFAPGSNTGQVFKKTIEKLKTNTNRYIAITFPGRGETKSRVQSTDAFKTINLCVRELVNILDLNEFDVYACSFGTMIVDQLLNDGFFYFRIQKIYLAFPGEYFSQSKRNLLKFLFFPAKNFMVCKIYQSILEIFIKPLKSVDPIIVLGQWLDTLSFSISNRIILKKTVLYFGNDKISTRQSEIKIMQKYTNSKIIRLNDPHPLNESIVQKVIDLTIPKY